MVRSLTRDAYLAPLCSQFFSHEHLFALAMWMPFDGAEGKRWIGKQYNLIDDEGMFTGTSGNFVLLCCSVGALFLLEVPEYKGRAGALCMQAARANAYNLGRSHESYEY